MVEDATDDLSGDVPAVEEESVEGISDYDTADLEERLGSTSGREVAEAEEGDISFTVYGYESGAEIVSTSTAVEEEGDTPSGSADASKARVSGIKINVTEDYDEAKIIVNQVAGPCDTASNDNIILLAGMISGSSNRGENLICIVLKKNGSVVKRSKLVLVETTFESPKWRFELRWDGTADLDSWLIQSDNTSNIVNWNTNPTTADFTGELDVDNKTAYGPENIKMTDIPSGTKVKYYVNPFSSGNAESFTVVVYKDGQVYEKHTRSLANTNYYKTYVYSASAVANMFYIGEYTY